VDLFGARYKFRLYETRFLYKTTQIFTWCKNSEVKVKISPPVVKHSILPRHTAQSQQPIDRHCNCRTATVFITATVLLQTPSYGNCLLCHFECCHAVVVSGFWLQLLASFIVIMDDCFVAAAAALAFVVVTVALF
jgi:hypothetical protein